MACYSTVQKGVALSSKTLENFYHYTCRRSPEELNLFSPSRDRKIPIGYIFIFTRFYLLIWNMVGKIIFAEGPLGVEFHHANIVRITLTLW